MMFNTLISIPLSLPITACDREESGGEADSMCEIRSRFRPAAGKKGAGFTLVELLVSMVILVIIMALLFGMTQQTSNLWRSTSGKIEGFRNSRAAFDALTRTLTQATLNTYYDYMDAGGNWMTIGSGTPATYGRRSDLHFMCGQGSTLLSGFGSQTPVTHCVFFQAPLGWSNTYTQPQLLNACGFYLVYGPDPNVPSFLPGLFASRYRYRLMQFLQPSENMTVYQTSAGTTEDNWFTTPITGSYDKTSNSVLAENVVALVIWPKASSGDQTAGTAQIPPSYSYDTRQSGTAATYNQLPPIVEVTMVCIDEPSALRLNNTVTPPNATVGVTQSGNPLFTTATYPAAGQQSQMDADLTRMETTLTTNHLTFRVFQTEVAIGGAKWSSAN
jgi:uncharacterized protein (TIGR02599 family)